MSDSLDTPILAELRKLRGELGQIRRELATLPFVLDDLNHRLDGVGQILTMMAGHGRGLPLRAERLETKLGGA